MTDHSPGAERPIRVRGAAALTVGGIVAAFGVASCCALPILLTTAGLGTAWLGGVATLAAPYRTFLLCLSALSLIAGAVMLGHIQQRAISCGAKGTCTPLTLRIALLAGLIAGTVLLCLGYSYV